MPRQTADEEIEQLKVRIIDQGLLGRDLMLGSYDFGGYHLISVDGIILCQWRINTPDRLKNRPITVAEALLAIEDNAVSVKIPV